MDGRVNVDSFSEKRINDSLLRQLMSRIKITENKAFTRQFPEKLTTEIEVLARGGQRFVETAQYPKGHAKNPMTDADVESKFGILCEGLMDGAQRDALLTTLWELDEAADLTALLDLLVLKT